MKRFNHKIPLENEITDFLVRSPKPIVFNGYRLHDFSKVRRAWLEEISSGTIDQRINRRAGLVRERMFYQSNPVFSSVARHHRHELHKRGVSLGAVWA